MRTVWVFAAFWTVVAVMELGMVWNGAAKGECCKVGDGGEVMPDEGGCGDEERMGWRTADWGEGKGTVAWRVGRWTALQAGRREEHVGGCQPGREGFWPFGM